MTRKRCAVIACAAVASMAMAACGDDDKDKGGDATKATPLAVTSTDAGKAVKLAAPESVEGGLVELTLTNKGKLPHSIDILTVDGSHTPAEILKQVNSPDGAPIAPWLHGLGGVGQTNPGQSSKATVVLPEGNYFLLDSGDQEEGIKGVVSPLKVEGGSADAKLPATEATIAMSEYAFAPTGLKAGTNTVTVKNTGKELHHALFFPIAKGKTFADAKKFVTTEGEPSGPPPLDFEGGTGTAVLDKGVSEVTDLTLKPGKYALICFLSDRKGGPPHVAKGMIQEVDVK